MKKHSSILLFSLMVFSNLTFFSNVVHSQPEQFVDKLFGKRFIFTPKEREFFVKFSETASQTEIEDIIRQADCTLKENELHGQYHKVCTFQTGNTFENVKSQLVQNPLVIGIMPVFIDQEGYERYVVPDLFTVQFNENITERRITEILKEWGTSIAYDHWAPGFYTLNLSEGLNVFEAVYNYMEWQDVKFVEPVYYCLQNELLADTYLNQQWHTNNTGQESGYIIGHDINASNAWDITDGVPDVILSIIDSGVDLTHPDLSGNYVPRGSDDWFIDSRSGYVGEVEPWATSSYIGSHGTQVSGVSSSIKNSIGVRGIASSCKMMPIRTNLDANEVAYQDRADAINYVVSRKNDFTRIIINCSWYTSAGDITVIHNAIQNAVNNNIPVFCAAGNDNTTPIVYPAKYSETISVGAMPPCGEVRKVPSSCGWSGWYDDWGSNYGSSLDISAPGARIYTTDLQGVVGFNPEVDGLHDLSNQDYTRFAYGTSIACPMVAATAALMISINSDLTVSEIRSILHTTADKVGGYTYVNGRCNDLGYGRLDTYEAVKYTIENYGGAIGGNGTTVTFHEDITIESGVELTIASGTTVKFEPNKKLTVKGTLNADDVSFESTSTHGEWGGLVFDGSSCSSSELYECTIEKAIVGITITGSNASPTIEKCLVHDCDSYPLKLTSGCTPNIYNSKFHADYSHAVYISSADGDFNENEFRTAGSTTYGVYVTGASSGPDFDSKEGDSGNLFDLSVIASHGVYAAGGYPEFGDSGPHDGNNDFINRGTDKYIYNNTGATINAEVNYWGGAPQSTWFSGSVDFSPYESSSNGAGPTWKAAINPFAAGVELFENGQYEDALTVLKAALQEDTESEKASSAVFKMAKSALKLNRLASEESFLKNLSISSNSEVQHISRVWLAYLYAMQGQIQEAEKIALQAPEGTLAQRTELLSLVSYYITFGDQKSAGRIARLLQENHKDAYLEYDLEVALETKLEFPIGPTVLTAEPPTFLVFKNYPNPFNPSTTIQFQLPEKNLVTLQIVDILGRLVQTVVAEEMAEGIHSVQWNGKNSTGNDVSAGVYFARIRTRDEINTIKLLLVR